MPQIKIADVEWAVCTKFNLTRDDLRGPPRGARRIFRPRQIAMYLCRELTQASYPKIGQHFRRDHTTVICARRRILSLLQTNPKVAGYVDEIRAALVCGSPRTASEREWAQRLVAGEVSWPSQP